MLSKEDSKRWYTQHRDKTLQMSETAPDWPVLCDGTISGYAPSEVRKAVTEAEVIDVTYSIYDDYVRVTMPDDGSKWKFTVTQWHMLVKQAADPNISLPKDSVEETIHVLYQGVPLCRFTQARPVDWPKGHYWVPMAEDMRGQSINNLCVGCQVPSMQLFEELFGKS